MTRYKGGHGRRVGADAGRGKAAFQLVAQLVEDAVDLGGGYVRIFASPPVIGQILFEVLGPQDIQFFSAVPPTVASSEPQ